MVLQNLIESGIVPVVRLTEVFRQAAGSQIISNAHRIRQGEMPELRGTDPTSDFHFVERDTQRDCRDPRQSGAEPNPGTIPS